MKLYVTTAALALLSLYCHAQQKEDKSKNTSWYYNAIKSEANPLKKEQLLVEMQQVGGGDNATPGFDIIDISRQQVAQAFAEEGNISKTQYWISRIKDSAGKISNELFLVRQLTEKARLADAEKLLLPVYNRLKGKPATTESGRSMILMPTAFDCEQLYGAILYKKGEYKKALEMLKPPATVQQERPPRRAGNSELYAMALAKSGAVNDAVEVMGNLILSSGHRSNEFNDVAIQTFSKKYGNDNRYKQLADSAAIIEQKKMNDKVAAMRVNEPAPDFELTDLNGKIVSLKSLRGKTVILDFWATWCQPCVASFPGMQRAVDYYRNDSSVVFMFIHTSEKNGNAPDEARQFMKYKKYRFDVYMDLRDQNTGASPVAASFKVRGIPAKFLIDKNGIIRYKNTGYISEEEAIPEIKTMIESVTSSSAVAQNTQEMAREIMQEKDPVKKEAMYEAAVKKYGSGAFPFVAQELAFNAAGRGDKEKMLHYMNGMTVAGASGSWAFTGYMAAQLATKNPAGALPLLKIAVDSAKANLEKRRSGSDTSRAAASLLERGKGNYYSYVSYYTQALIATGKPEEAWMFIEPVYMASGKPLQLSIAYAETAVALKKFNLAFPLMEQEIVNGTASAKTESNFKNAYIAVKGSSAGYDQYREALEKRKTENMLKDVMVEAVNTPAKPFVLKDVNGKEVSLTGLKGKVIVLDFWATWCGPCKASFPIMQKAVNKYKNDPQVQFLFVHTMDKGDANPTEAAAKYLNDNNYNFQVLMDLRNSQTGRSAVSSDYGITAIPTKVVIDGKGNIRFQVTGFKSLDDRAVAELSSMIEIARKGS